MKIRTIQLREIKIPLNFRFEQSNNSGTSHSNSAILSLTTSDGLIGYGESCPRTYVTGEHIDDLADDLERLLPGLVNHPIHSIEELQHRLEAWAEQGIGPSTRCAIELAWLDAWSRTQERSLSELLPFSSQGVLSYSLVLPFLAIGSMEKLLPQLKRLQPPAIKLKVGTDNSDDRSKVKLIREVFGPEVPIRVDVNGGWSFDQAKAFIPGMAALGVHSFEQAVEPNDLASMKKLTRLFGKEVEIMADESLLDYASAEKFLEEQICNHFNLKISKLGGVFASLKIYKLAESRGIPCQLGAHFGETSLLTSAGALLGSMTGGLFSACEGALGELLLSEDIALPAIQHQIGGQLVLSELWQKPGLVEEVSKERLSRFTV